MILELQNFATTRLCIIYLVIVTFILHVGSFFPFSVIEAIFTDLGNILFFQVCLS